VRRAVTHAVKPDNCPANNPTQPTRSRRSEERREGKAHLHFLESVVPEVDHVIPVLDNACSGFRV